MTNIYEIVSAKNLIVGKIYKLKGAQAQDILLTISIYYHAFKHVDCN
jgi:hypothetical protein